jgi:high-affinity iron transporter
MGQLGNVVFILWRESIEALLVVGILNAWLSRQTDPAERRRGRMYLWSGVAAGLVVAALLGAALMGFSDLLSDDALQIYQTVMVLVAAALIVQMVLWMRRHGRTLKRELETALQSAADRANWWGVFVLALIAVAREGSETVVFLAGSLAAARGESLTATSFAALGGFSIAVFTYYLLQVGSRFVSWQVFFRITEIMLLLLAAALLIAGVDNLIDLDLVPRLSGRLWDTSMILPQNGAIGGMIASLTGYRAKPDLTELLVFACYWAAMAWLLMRPPAASRSR